MSALLATIKEFFAPESVRHPFIPPMEGGLRPNQRIESAEAVSRIEDGRPDDVILTPDGAVWTTSRSTLRRIHSSGTRIIVLPATAVSLTYLDGNVFVAVEGYGIFAVGADFEPRLHCADPAIQRCVTSLTVVDGRILGTTGSSTRAADEWRRALVAGDRSGAIVAIDGEDATILADDLAWPAGIAVGDDGEILLSLSLTHRIERRSLDRLNAPGAVVVMNLPVYPGRITPGSGGYWVAAPYARNASSEFVLQDDDLRADMERELEPDEWLVPQLTTENPYRAALQNGQLRVLGVIKPWAPPRSYGCVFHLTADGHIDRSMHSRADGRRHGVAGVAVDGETIVITSAASSEILRLKAGSA